MPPFLSRRQLILLWVGLALLLATSATACALLGSRLREPAAPVSPDGGATPQPTATPIAQRAGPLGARAALVNGRPYLVESVTGATFSYEAWTDYHTVEQAKAAYAVTVEVLRQELGVVEIPYVEVYLAPEDESARLAESQGFPHPSWLMGLSTYNLREGKVVDAKIILNSDAEGLLHNVGHELAHLAVPGLPTWLSEGLAEYIGTRAERGLDPQRQSARVLFFRRMVRDAVAQGTLLDRRQFETFDWFGDHPYRTIDLAYAQAWNLVEYIAGYDTPDALRSVVVRYRQGVPEDEDVFQSALGVGADQVWQGFTQDIGENLMVEELEGVGLCSLVRLGNEGAAINRDWNQFLARTEALAPSLRAPQLGRFQQGWQALADSAAAFPLLGDAWPIRELLVSNFRSMAQAMGYYASGQVATANQTVAEANRLTGEVNRALQDAFRQRPWLAC